MSGRVIGQPILTVSRDAVPVKFPWRCSCFLARPGTSGSLSKFVRLTLFPYLAREQHSLEQGIDLQESLRKTASSNGHARP